MQKIIKVKKDMKVQGKNEKFTFTLHSNLHTESTYTIESSAAVHTIGRTPYLYSVQLEVDLSL